MESQEQSAGDVKELKLEGGTSTPHGKKKGVLKVEPHSPSFNYADFMKKAEHSGKMQGVLKTAEVVVHSLQQMATSLADYLKSLEEESS